jgi:hypothetical protein
MTTPRPPPRLDSDDRAFWTGVMGGLATGQIDMAALMGGAKQNWNENRAISWTRSISASM